MSNGFANYTENWFKENWWIFTIVFAIITISITIITFLTRENIEKKAVEESDTLNNVKKDVKKIRKDVRINKKNINSIKKKVNSF